MEPLTMFAGAMLIQSAGAGLAGWAQGEAAEKNARMSREQMEKDRAQRERMFEFQRKQWYEEKPARQTSLMQGLQGAEDYETRLKKNLYRLKGLSQ